MKIQVPARFSSGDRSLSHLRLQYLSMDCHSAGAAALPAPSLCALEKQLKQQAEEEEKEQQQQYREEEEMAQQRQHRDEDFREVYQEERQETQQQPERHPSDGSSIPPESSSSIDALLLRDDNVFSVASSLCFSDSMSSRHDADRLEDARLALPMAVSRLASLGGLSSCTEMSEDELRLAEVNPVTFDNLHQHPQRPDLAASASIDNGSSAPYGNPAQSSSRLSDDVDLSSDGESSLPAVYVSDCHCGGSLSPGASSMTLQRFSYPSDEPIYPRVKVMCSFGGRIMSRPIDRKLRYVGGETRIVAVNRGIVYEEFMSKMMQFYGVPLGLKYQLPDEDLDALISVSSDDDLQNMMEEYDKLESSGGVSRLRLFFFTSQSDYEASQLALKDEAEDRRTNQEERYVDAINGITEKSSGNHFEDDAQGFRLLHNFTESGAKLSQDVKTASTAPSAPSSSPSSPPLAPRQTHFKPQGMGDSLLQERLNKVAMKPSAFEGSSLEVDQDGAASSVYCDHQSPRRIHHDVAVSRGESWRIAEAGMHRVDSQTKLMRQSEQHMDRGSAPGLVDPWHDLQQPASEMLLPRVEPQLLVFHQHKQVPQHHHQQAWQPQMELNLRMGETVQHCASDIPRQLQVFHQPHQVVQQPHQPAHLRLHQVVAGHEGSPRHSERQGFIPFPQGHVQQPPSEIPLGLAYQMGSAPSSPRAAGHERCSCAQQHSQVHRGITVSLSDQSYGRKTPHFGDQHTRNHGLVHSSRFCDNPSHCGEPLVWQPAPSHFTVSDVERQEQFGNPWQHVHGTHTVHCHLPECQARNRLAHQYCDPPIFRETLLASHDRHESNKTRCSCINCHDQRGQHMEKAVVHPVYADIQDQVGDWIMHQKNLDLDDGRIPTVGRVLCNAPVHKDEDLRKEYEVGKCVQSEPDLFLNHAQGGFESRRALATPVEGAGAIHHGNLPVRVVPMNRPLVPEDLQAHEDSNWHSMLPAAVADSWNMSTLEPRVWSDVLPPVNAGVPNRLTEEGNFLSKAATKIDFVSNPVPTMEGEKGSPWGSPRSDMFIGNFGQDLGADSNQTLLRDDRGRPITSSFPVGETATEVTPVQSCTTCTHGYNGAGAPVATNGGAHLVDSAVILTGSLAPSHAAPPWQASPPANLSMTALESSSSTLAFPVYDQSPLSSINTTDFNFEPSEPRATPGRTNVDNGSIPSRMSLTGLLADGMISSVLKSCSNEVSHRDSGDLEVANLNSPKVNSPKVAKNETEEGTGIVLLGSMLQGRGLSFTKADTVNASLTLNVEGQLSGGLPPMQNGTHKVACEDDSEAGPNQEKDAEAQSVCAKDPKLLSLTQAEAEARARGLQMIKNADLEDMRELGSGTFGTVFHGKWRGSDVAIKRIKASCFMGRPSQQERLISDFWKEACTLGQLHHPNVVAFYGVVPDGPGGTLATVTEYMVNGSLKQVLHKKDRTIDRRKRLFLAMDAAFGMEYLHSKNIVHFDLKCENLLVNMRDAHRPICKVGDFGLSKVKHQTLVSGGVRGTLPWMAPELLSGNGSMVTEKIDVFSFGVVMWELLTGEEPYANMHCGAIIGGIVNNTLRPPIPSWCDPGWRTLMERCWSGDPADRPSFSEVAKELRAIAASMNLK